MLVFTAKACRHGHVSHQNGHLMQRLLLVLSINTGHCSHILSHSISQAFKGLSVWWHYEVLLWSEKNNISNFGRRSRTTKQILTQASVRLPWAILPTNINILKSISTRLRRAGCHGPCRLPKSVRRVALWAELAEEIPPNPIPMNKKSWSEWEEHLNW